jgi:hypothetical protein
MTMNETKKELDFSSALRVTLLYGAHIVLDPKYRKPWYKKYRA